MPQFDVSTFLPQLFWLVVTFLLLLFAMRRYALPRLSEILETRQKQINDDLERAAALKDEAEAVLADYEKALAEARDKAAGAVKAAGEELAAQAAKEHAAFGEELAKRTREAEERIHAAKAEALANLKTVAAEIAGSATRKLIGVEPGGDQVTAAVNDVLGGKD